MTGTGTSSKEVEALLTRAQQEIDEGLLPGCQLAIARHGEVEVFEAFGEATLDSRFVIFSATKAFVASLMWMHIADGLVDVSLPVTEYIPEFATNGKESITVEQVMLHPSGFPPAPLGPPQWSTREGRVAAFARWRLNWEPGSRLEYHATSAHWVLAELIALVDGVELAKAVRRRVLEPLGLSRLQLGVPK